MQIEFLEIETIHAYTNNTVVHIRYNNTLVCYRIETAVRPLEKKKKKLYNKGQVKMKGNVTCSNSKRISQYVELFLS